MPLPGGDNVSEAVERRAAPVDDCWNRIGVWSRGRASCPELQQVIHCRNCQRYSSAGRSMLERPMSDEYQLEWTERLATADSAPEDRSRSVLVFRLGDEWIGLDCRFVQEISEMRSIHSLPHKTGTLIKGLVNMRGELKLCLSIGALLQLDKATEDYRVDHEIHERLIYVAKQDQSFVFPVSEVHGVHRYCANSVKATPSTLAKAKQSFTAGVLAWENRHIGLIDDELLFYALAEGLK
jgi:chemotaxis-related protein WspD